ncbi:MAG: hypothetical protein J1E40_06995 [Oscillospiraceae bacterium]|nr:hypothetical protein [Oscillospiraceae bacterium]
MELFFVVLTGLIAGLLMFSGDMLLYYDKKDYVSDGKFDSVIDIMKNLSDKRLYAGGIIGPIAAFLYCIGYYHIVLIADDKIFVPAMTSFLLSCLGIIIGGAYHSHCAYLGLIGKLDDKKAMDTVIKYFTALNKLSVLFQAAGLLIILACVALGWTELPNWLAIFTPGVLYLLLPLMKKLPKGIHIIICGGWANLIFVIYYLAVLIYISL